MSFTASDFSRRLHIALIGAPGHRGLLAGGDKTVRLHAKEIDDGIGCVRVTITTPDGDRWDDAVMTDGGPIEAAGWIADAWLNHVCSGSEV